MRIVRSLVLLLSSCLCAAGFADTTRIDWNLSSLIFDDAPGVTYNVVKLDIDGGDSNSRYYSVGGALRASDSASATVFPVTGTCMYVATDTIKCGLMFERGALVIDVGPTLSGTFAVKNQSGVSTHTGTVIYTGIVQ